MSDKKIRSIKDMTQTAIFLCFLLIFPVFSLALYLYSLTSLELHEVFEKSFSVSLGVFGGAATLTAAYIAVLLFNDWRIEFNKQVKDKYFVDTLTLMRSDLIKFAPIFNSIINTCDNYIHKDIVADLTLNLCLLEKLYSSHKTTALIFREYHFITKDDVTYLAYLKFYSLQEELLSILIRISKTENKVNKLDELTTQLFNVLFPIKLSNGRPVNFDIKEMLPVDMCRYLEHYYLKIVEIIANQKLAK